MMPEEDQLAERIARADGAAEYWYGQYRRACAIGEAIGAALADLDDKHPALDEPTSQTLARWAQSAEAMVWVAEMACKDWTNEGQGEIIGVFWREADAEAAAARFAPKTGHVTSYVVGEPAAYMVFVDTGQHD